MGNSTRYALLERIRERTAIHTYRARRLSDGAPVVLKLAARPEGTAALRHEHGILSSLDIQGVVRALAMDELDGKTALVLEDAGDSLADLRSAGPMPMDIFLSVADQLTHIMEAVHRRNIVHKDINPTNIVSRDGGAHVTLVDFSLATMLAEESVPFLPLRQIEGTPAYMSPEQTGRMNRPLDHRTDYYAIGATFYELLIGRPPFTAKDIVELMHAHLAQRPAAPHTLSDRVPAFLSAVVLKLLSKDPEDRYQSMSGLRADLALCREGLEKRIEPSLSPGTRDRPERFHLPQKLYAREAHAGQLLSAFERACGGNGAVLAVSGPSGIGKSTLVHDVHRMLTQRRGCFLSGKFDRYARGTPYLAVVQALSALVQQLLAEDEASLQQTKTELEKQLGEDAALLVEACPAFRHLAARAPPFRSLPPNDARDRFHRAVRRLLSAVATRARPLCVFIDDLQWADADSLKLLEEVASALSQSHILLIVACRDPDAGDVSAVSTTLDRIEGAGVPLLRVDLTPLAEEDIAALLGDLSMPPGEERRTFTRMILARTAGNPFFVRTFLRALHAHGALRFDAAFDDGAPGRDERSLRPKPAFDDGAPGRDERALRPKPAFDDKASGRAEHAQWLRFDAVRAHAVGAADNVVALLIERVRTLSPHAQEVLAYAACLGPQSDLGTIAAVAELPLEEVVPALWEAITADLMLPLDAVRSPVEMLALGPAVRFRFAHDRVQQATLSMAGERKGPGLHRAVGLRLFARLAGEIRSPLLFEAANQMNLGRAAIDDAAELRDLAQLNLLAARQALRSAAAEQALAYARTGLTTFAATDWQGSYELARDLHLAGAEAAFAVGHLDEAHPLCAMAISHANDKLDEINARKLQGQLFYSQQRIADALATYREAMRRVGIDLPDAPTADDTAEELRLTLEATAGSEERLASLPECDDPLAAAVMDVLVHLIQIAGSSNSSLLPIVTCQLVRECLLHGHTPDSVSGYLYYGILLMRGGDVARAISFCRFSVVLAERYASKHAIAHIYPYAYFHVLHVEMPLSDLSARLFEAYRCSLDIGNPFLAAANAMTMCFTRFLSGEDLRTVGPEMDRYAAVIGGLNQTLVLGWHRIYRQLVMNLAGDSESPTDLVGTAYDERLEVEKQRAAGDVGGLANYHIAKALLLYLFGELGPLQSLLAEGSKYLITGATAAVAGLWHLTDALGRLAALDRAEPGDPALAATDAPLQQLKAWAPFGPLVFNHRVALIEAEQARVLGQDEQAMSLFEQATDLAKKSQIAHEEGIACETAARFFLSRNDRRRALVYMRDAHRAYLRWGALAKVRHLERLYPYLVSRVATDMPSAATLHTAAGGGRDFDVVDVMSVLNASQVISGEVDLQRLLDRLMRILLETSGAEMGAILRQRNGLWVVEAQRIAGRSDAYLDPVSIDDLAALGRPALPKAVVLLVANTQEPVLLDDAAASAELGGDPVIAERRVRSVLCFPLLRQGSLSGVAYLENSLLAGAFPPARVRLLELLSGQAVISMENAALYADLEQKVEDRTQELREKNEVLAGTLHELQRTQDRLIVQDRLASLGRMVAGIAHELRNPLNFVANFAELSMKQLREAKRHTSAVAGEAASETAGLEKVHGALHANLERIRDHGRRMDGIVRSILEHSRSGTGQRECLDLNALVEKFVDLSIQGYHARSSSVRVHVSFDLDPAMGKIDVVPQEMSRILLNLMDNALYALQKKREALGDPYEPAVRVSTRRQSGTVQIRVHDNGIGIPQSIVDQIFEPFFTTKQVGEGTGLGLSICYDIVVKGYGGLFTIETSEGQFTEITMSLPAP
jgi:histidine kinase